MYKSFFELDCSPFEISPDPHFFYPTLCHDEAMANLYYAVQSRKGLIVITGEVGTGKTLLVRCLLEKLVKNGLQCAYVFNPLLGPLEFLRYVAMDLGLPADSSDKCDLLQRLNSFLIQRHDQGQTTVLVLDEAHLLGPEVLEESRLLCNLETTKGKLLQIALVGQPELDEKLDSSSMRQLKQRVTMRCSLKPLEWDDTKAYVHWRLQRAGASVPEAIFPEDSLRVVFDFSRGIPRLINTICENALISGFAATTRRIPPSMVQEACADLHIKPYCDVQNGEAFVSDELREGQFYPQTRATSSGSQQTLRPSRPLEAEQLLEEGQ